MARKMIAMLINYLCDFMLRLRDGKDPEELLEPIWLPFAARGITDSLAVQPLKE